MPAATRHQLPLHKPACVRLPQLNLHLCMPQQVRNMQREVSRDADIVVAAMISIVGSTLIFQGWRLDPLLLLCQVCVCRPPPAFQQHTTACLTRAHHCHFDQHLLPAGQAVSRAMLEYPTTFQTPGFLHTHTHTVPSDKWLLCCAVPATLSCADCCCC